MKLLVINSNCNQEITAKLQKVAESIARPGTEVDCLCPAWGVPAVQGYHDGVLAAHATVELLRMHEMAYDVFIIACYSDPGLFAAREITGKPVYGIAQSSMLAALPFGHKFSILSPLSQMKPILENLVRTYGMESKCASIRTVELDVLQSFSNEAQANEAFIEAGKRAVSEDGADVLCLGGAIFAGRDRVISQAVGVTCIDGLSSALKMAEGYYDLDYSTSKSRTFHEQQSPGGVQPL